ncbi:uncharacterized protein VTP21DRAFT_4368 [Calcarisporiella thermophila]|uniref:uncharacterized protein n=1 Tax=Calcarisporiella thermophila TaxID=911321 RepID=UPI003742455E
MPSKRKSEESSEPVRRSARVASRPAQPTPSDHPPIPKKKKTEPKDAASKEKPVKKENNKVEKEKKKEVQEKDAKQEKEIKEEVETKPKVANSVKKFSVLVERCSSCTSYKNQADRVIKAIKEVYPNAECQSVAKPRSKCFEIYVKDGDKDTQVWSGKDKGPPRKLKFPDNEKVIQLVSAEL